MLFTVQGRYRNGHIEVAERPLGVEEAHVLITFLSEGQVAAAGNGQAAKPDAAKTEAAEATGSDKTAADKPEQTFKLPPIVRPPRPDLSPMIERISALSGTFADLHYVLRELLLGGQGAEAESKPAAGAPRGPFGKVDKKIPVLERSASPAAQLAPPPPPAPPAPKVEKPEAPRPLPSVALPPSSPLGAALAAAPPPVAAPAPPAAAGAGGAPAIDWFAPRPQRDFAERRGPYIPWFIEDEDLPIIEKRCRLKAEGMRWAAERARKIEAGSDFELDIRPKDHDIIGRAKEIPNCFLWMNQPPGPTPDELPYYEEVAACFEVLGTAVALAEEMKNMESCPEEVYRETLSLLAEAQSMLKTAVERINRDVDADQRMVHRWLRNATEERRIYIDRHMNAADPADPTNRNKLNVRILRAQQQLQQFREKDKNRKKKFSKISYLADRLKGGTLSRPELETEWRTLVETVDEMVTEGVPPSSVELRQRLLPLMSILPPMENPPQGFERTVREVQRYLQLNAAAKVKAEEEEADEAPTEEVRQVAEMMNGKTLVMIGGERREHAVRKMCQAFGLKDVDWVDTASKPSFHSFESHVSSSDVAVVILAIRWSSHSYTNVQTYCQKHDKPLVRLPAGYGVNQVAHAIIEQVGERLASAVKPAKELRDAVEAKDAKETKETFEAKAAGAKAAKGNGAKEGNGLKEPAAKNGNGAKESSPAKRISAARKAAAAKAALKEAAAEAGAANDEGAKTAANAQYAVVSETIVVTDDVAKAAPSVQISSATDGAFEEAVAAPDADEQAASVESSSDSAPEAAAHAEQPEESREVAEVGA